MSAEEEGDYEKFGADTIRCEDLGYPYFEQNTTISFFTWEHQSFPPTYNGRSLTYTTCSSLFYSLHWPATNQPFPFISLISSFYSYIATHPNINSYSSV